MGQNNDTNQIILSSYNLDELLHAHFLNTKSTLEEIFASRLEEIKKMLQPQSPEITKLLSRTEAAKYLGITPTTLTEYVDTGKVKGYSMGSRMLRFKYEDLDACLEEIVATKKVSL